MLIGTAVVGATTMIFSIIVVLTHGLTQNLDKLSLLHPPFLLGLITGGAIIVVTIFSLNRIVAEARLRIPMIQRLLEFEPTTIGRNGKWLKDQMEEQGLDLDDVQAALREHGLIRAEQMQLAVLEEDGSISIVPAPGEDTPQAKRRRRRYKRSAF